MPRQLAGGRGILATTTSFRPGNMAAVLRFAKGMLL
jgi:hypothetical protein